MKTAIITGASGNLGQAVVKKFVKEGYKAIGTVTSTDTTPPEIPAAQFEKIVVDLLNEEDSQKTIDAVVSKNERIDVAVLTVGGFAMGHIAETTTNDLMQQYRLNFETAYNKAVNFYKKRGYQFIASFWYDGKDNHDMLKEL